MKRILLFNDLEVKHNNLFRGKTITAAKLVF